MAELEPARVSRRGFIGTASRAGLAAAAIAGGSWPGSALASAAAAETVPARPEVPDRPHGRTPGPDEALKILMAGNSRWMRGQARHPRQSPRWRHYLADHQDPFATVISCIDSRVPPELVFDCGLGELLVIRTGAQTLDDQVVLGSIEFGPASFESARLMVVLGHGRCGAVKAAIRSFQTGEPAPGHIGAVVRALRPAYEAAIRQSGDLLDNTIRAQIKLTVRQLRHDPLLHPMVRSGHLQVRGGLYDMVSGAVGIIA